MLKTEERLEYNLKIIERLTELCKEFPQMRFNQMLFSLGIIESAGQRERGMLLIKDKFNEEPDITLNQIEKILIKIRKANQ